MASRITGSSAAVAELFQRLHGGDRMEPRQRPRRLGESGQQFDHEFDVALSCRNRQFLLTLGGGFLCLGGMLLVRNVRRKEAPQSDGQRNGDARGDPSDIVAGDKSSERRSRLRFLCDLLDLLLNRQSVLLFLTYAFFFFSG